MKKTFLFSVIFTFFLIASQTFGNDVHFIYPVNNESFTCGSNNTAAVNILWFESDEGDPHVLYYYIKLFTDQGTYSTRVGTTTYPPSTLYVGGGVHSWRIELYQGYILTGYESKVAQQSITFNVKYTIFAANNFGGGSINLENSTVTSGSSVIKLIGESVAVGAIDQNDGAGYNRIWNSSGINNSNWIIHFSNIIGATPRNYSYTVASGDNGAILTADLKKICNVTFQNSGHQITINGNGYSSTGTVQSVEGNPTTVSTDSYYSSNGLDNNFSCWTNAGLNYSSPITVYNHSSFIAKYIGTPNIANQSINFSTTLYSPIIVFWTDNPNTNVNQYQIYRRIGYIGTPTLIGTVGRGVQQFTDNTWTRMPWKVDTLLCYEVKEYYSIDQTYSPDYWASVYGSSMWKSKNKNSLIGLVSELPTEYKLDNYPNPFNPVTVINYQLPQDGFVTLKVFDMLGKKVATVVNEYKNAGYYKVNFDASRLTSGVYIYTINTNNFFQSKKMLLMK
jgi:hypothetical protein